MTTLPALVFLAAATAQPQGVLLDFSASWCGPCQQMSPIVSRLKRQGYPIRKVDVDREKKLARRFRVQSIPAFVLVVNGKEVDRVVGATSENRLKKMMARIPRGESGGRSSKNSARQDRQQSQASSRSAGSSRRNSTSPNSSQSGKPSKPTFEIPVVERSNGRGETAHSADTSSGETSSPREEKPVIRAKLDNDRNRFENVITNDPMAASVRIRIRDKKGVNFGSGTIIDSRPGRTLILTCGHIFRGLGEDSKIEVDIFHDQKATTFIGKAVNHNMKADVGLLAIPTSSPLSCCRVSPVGTDINQGDHVFSVGCGGGEKPSKQQLRITALNRYLGPDNIECTGVPVQGRSGGGLFDTSGRVIGVCSAADPKEKRGLYAGMKAVHQLLDQSDLSRLYRKPSPSHGRKQPEVQLAQENHETEETPPFAEDASDEEKDGALNSLASLKAAMNEDAQEDSSVSAAGFDSEQEFKTPVRGRFEENLSLQATSSSREKNIQKIQNALSGSEEAEVVCIIRPLSQPRASSRVVIINRASPKFVSYLTGEMESQPRPTTASYTYRKPGTAEEEALEITDPDAIFTPVAGSKLGKLEELTVSRISRESGSFGGRRQRFSPSEVSEKAKSGSEHDAKPVPFASSTGETENPEQMGPRRYRRSESSR